MIQINLFCDQAECLRRDDMKLAPSGKFYTCSTCKHLIVKFESVDKDVSGLANKTVKSNK